MIAKMAKIKKNNRIWRITLPKPLFELAKFVLKA